MYRFSLAKARGRTALAALLFGILATAPVFASDDAFMGRWLFRIATQTGGFTPVFIVEFDQGTTRPKAKLLHAQADLDFTIPRFEIASDGMVIDLQSARGTLSFVAQPVTDDLLKGAVNGGAFINREFLAERTELTVIGGPKPPTREEQADYARGAVKRDPQERITGLKAFLRKHSESDLKPRAYQDLFTAYLEWGEDDEGLVEAAEAMILNAPDRLKAKSDIAMQMAVRGRRLDVAQGYAEEALYESNPNSPDRPEYLLSRGWVAMKKGQAEDAIRYLREARKLRPDDGRTAILLAEALKASGDAEGALELYLSAYVNSGSQRAKQVLEDAYRKEHGSVEGLHAEIDKAYARVEPLFDHGKYQGPKPERVVLVEQFTGTECMPCQASDYAYEGLGEHYPEDVVIPIQYHLHIPQPDPLTNTDSKARGDWYDVHSTPMVFFGGTQKRAGGGAKAAAGEFFKDYRSVIDKQLGNATSVDIEVSGRLNGEVLTYQATANLGHESPGDLRLRLALVEAMVHYTGHNGTHFHRNVVRKLLPQPNGLGPAGGTSATIAISGKQDIAALETDLKSYLEKYQEDTGRSFSELMHEIDSGQLRLVAFVQNQETKEVLQAKMVPVSVE